MSKVNAAIPVNDNMIFVDEDGYLSERIGIAYTDDGVEYIDTKGYVCGIYDNPTEAIVGKKGDTITFRDLEVAYRQNKSDNDVLSNAMEYFTISKENLEDTVVMTFDTNVCGDHNARLDILSDFFPHFFAGFINFHNEDYNCRDERIGTLDYLTEALYDYSRLIGKRPNLEIYITKQVNTLLDDNILVSDNEKIYEIERKYLPGLRKYINDRLDARINELAKNDASYEAWQALKGKLKERFASKFDKDPNYMG